MTKIIVMVQDLPSPRRRSIRLFLESAAFSLSRSFCSRSSFAAWFRAAAPRMFFLGVCSIDALMARASSEDKVKALSISGEIDLEPVRCLLIVVLGLGGISCRFLTPN